MIKLEETGSSRARHTAWSLQRFLSDNWVAMAVYFVLIGIIVSLVALIGSFGQESIKKEDECKRQGGVYLWREDACVAGPTTGAD